MPSFKIHPLDPVREMSGLRDAVSGLFDDVLGGRAARLQADGEAQGTWAPAVDARESEDALVLTVALPGVEKSAIHLEVKEGTLTLAGVRKAAADDRAAWVRRELPTGPFYRAFNLPADIAADKVQADYKDGQLEIRLPRAEASRPRKVEIA